MTLNREFDDLEQGIGLRSEFDDLGQGCDDPGQGT